MRLFGAARKSAQKAARKRKAEKEKELEWGFLKKGFPRGYGGGFKPFLKSGRSLGKSERAHFQLLVRAKFIQYVGQPVRILPIPLGEMTRLQAQKLTEADLLEIALVKPWASEITKVLGVYAMRVKSVRVEIGRKRRRKSKKLREEAKRLEDRARELRRKAKTF